MKDARPCASTRDDIISRRDIRTYVWKMMDELNQIL